MRATRTGHIIAVADCDALITTVYHLNVKLIRGVLKTCCVRYVPGLFYFNPLQVMSGYIHPQSVMSLLGIHFSSELPLPDISSILSTINHNL